MRRSLRAGAACGAALLLAGCALGGGGRDASQARVEQAAVDTAEAFWTEQLPALYDREYERLAPDRVRPFTSERDALLECGPRAFAYEDVAGNAFAAPCPEGVAVAWDASQLFPQLRAAFGDVAPAVVLAHEWGHVAQFQAGVRLPTVYLEQQADCWAGAWTAGLGSDPPQALADLTTEGGLDGALATLIAVRDPLGSTSAQEGAHGSGFDRVRAFQEGYERGAETCADYADQPPTLVDLPFRSAEEVESGGNLPLDVLVPLATTDLDAFYEASVDGFEPLGAPSLDELDRDEQRRLEALADIGDSAPATLLGLSWAKAAQEASGADAGGDEGAALQRACMTGGWLSAILSGRSAGGDISLSPGDLDESILGLLALAQSDATEVGGGAVSGFELVSTFRQGVLQGFGSCGV